MKTFYSYFLNYTGTRGKKNMRSFIIENCMKIISQNKNYTKTKLAEIKYGLETLYLLISKLIIIGIIAAILGILKELIIFILIYNIIRMPSFGLHATKSWICLLSSTIIFIGLPLIMKNIELNTITKIIIGSILTITIFIFSPADTKKRPIVNKKRRKIYKTLSTIISIIYVILSVTIKKIYIENCFIFSIILQNILISPITYRIFKLPYNNYKEYIKTHGLNE